MKISKTMVKYYLDYVTVVYFGDHTRPPEELADYDDCIENIRIFAADAGDLPWLQLALQHLLSHTDLDLSEYRGVFPFQSEEVRQILEHVWATLWPESTVPDPGEGVEVDLVPMSAEDWAATRRRYAAGS